MNHRNDVRMQSGPIPLTREGRRVLAAKLEHLRDEIIPELLTLRESSGYDNDVENDYQHAVGQLASLCERLARSCAVETTPDDPRVVELGELVTLCLDDGTLVCYLVVHPFEAPDRWTPRLLGSPTRAREAVWSLANEGRGALLIADEHYEFPARIDTDTGLLEAAEDVAHPDVVDDVVDEIIEIVLAKGGRVAIVSDGTLRDHGRIAMTLRH